MTVDGIIVDDHFGIGRKDPVVGSLKDRIDLKKGSIGFNIRFIEGLYKGGHLLESFSLESQVEGDLAALKGCNADS